MAETTVNKPPKKSSAINWYVWMIVILILIIIAGMAINICIMNKQFKKNEAAYSTSKQVNNPLRSLKPDSTKSVNLKEEDLQKFNDHIDYLSDKVETEVKRTQENSQYDIDRINTMLAIGIGILAIIGGLLPIFVNYFSKENLEKRMEEFENESKQITLDANVAKGKANEAKGEAKAASNKVKGLDATIDDVKGTVNKINEQLPKLHEGIDELKKAAKKVPFIDLLSFQNAVAKLTSTDAMKLFVGDERIKWIVGYLENLILAINNFDDGIHSFSEYSEDNLKSFKSVISEFKVALFLGPIRRIPDGRSFQAKIDEAVALLGMFDKLEVKDYKEQLKAVSKTILELKELVEKKAA